MSLTKRYLESLPEEKQNAILGPIDYPIDFDGCNPDEWTNDAENEPTCDVCGGSGWIVLTGPDTVQAVCPFCNKDGHKTDADSAICCDEPTDAELAEWAQALMEEEEEEPNDPPVKCRICRKMRPISEMNTNGECPPCQRETALLVKPQPKRVDCGGWSI